MSDTGMIRKKDGVFIPGKHCFPNQRHTMKPALKNFFRAQKRKFFTTSLSNVSILWRGFSNFQPLPPSLEYFQSENFMQQVRKYK